MAPVVTNPSSRPRPSTQSTSTGRDNLTAIGEDRMDRSISARMLEMLENACLLNRSWQDVVRDFPYRAGDLPVP